jgi:predicted transcriptional regulator
LTQGIRDPHNIKCETVVTKPPVLLESAGVLERMDAFLVGHFKALPVVDKQERPLGITTRVELLKDMKNANLIPNFAVSELMSSPVYTIDENEVVATVKSTFKEKKAHKLAVTKRGEIVGVVSAYDIASWSTRVSKQGGRKDIHESATIDEMKISSFLRPDVTRIRQDSSLQDAVNRMIEKQVSTVIVALDNKPLGVISALDIFKKIQDMAEERLQVQVSGLDKEDAEYY